MSSILDIKDLTVIHRKGTQEKTVVDHISFSAEAQKITCLMGESGSGKSMTVLSILGLLPEGMELESEESIRFYGDSIFCIFQDPMNSFNFSIKVKKQMYAMAKGYRKAAFPQFMDEIKQVMSRLNFENPAEVLEKYPFELSGGMLQRLMVACAVYTQPSLIIADEPTTALDVTVQNQLLDEFRKINEEMGIAILMITHDFGIAAELADTIIVMNQGHIEEQGSVWNIFDCPQSQYTRSLIRASTKELE